MVQPRGAHVCGGLSASVLRLRPGVTVDLGHYREEELLTAEESENQLKSADTFCVCLLSHFTVMTYRQ